jgi:hypothetical protein
MNAYYELLRVLKKSLEDNVNINTVTQGNIAEMDLDKKTIFPLAHIDASNGSFQENIMTFNVTIHAMDIVDYSNEIIVDKFIGNDNEIDILNTMLAVLRRTYLELAKDVHTEMITINSEPNFSLKEGYSNSLLGWEMSFSVEVPDTIISVC